MFDKLKRFYHWTGLNSAPPGTLLYIVQSLLILNLVGVFRGLYYAIGVHNAQRGTLLYAFHRGLKSSAKARVERLRAALSKKKPLVTLKHTRMLPVVGVKKGARKKNILILKLDHLGDFVIAIPALRMLRQMFKDDAITLVCGSWCREFAESLRMFDRVVVFDYFTERQKDGDPQDPDVSLSELCDDYYDVAVDLRVFDESRELLTKVKAGVRCGVGTRKVLPFLDISLPLVSPAATVDSEPTRWPADLHMGEILTLLCLLIRERLFGPAQMTLSPDQFPEGLALLRDCGSAWNDMQLVCIAPLSNQEIKDWPLAYYVELCQMLLEQPKVFIVLLGTSGQRDALATIVRECGMHPRMLDLAGKTRWNELPMLFSQAEIVIGNDSGTGHLAAACGAKVLTIFSGAHQAQEWAPRGAHVETLSASPPCAPCRCVLLSECEHGHVCIRSIKPEDVYNRIVAMVDFECRQELVA